MRVFLLLLFATACREKPIPLDTDPLDTGDVDTTDVDTGFDSDTLPDPPVRDVTRAQPVGGGAVQVNSLHFGMEVTVGTPVHGRVLTSENYRLTVGVIAPTP